MSRYWVVRLGEGGKYVEDGREGKYIAIGWGDLGDLSWLTRKEETPDNLKKIYKEKYKEESEAQVSIGHGQIWSFVTAMTTGDIILVPYLRKVLIGKVSGPYIYRENWGDRCPYPHRRMVKWITEVGRDDLSQRLKASIGAWQTVFNLDNYAREIDYLITGEKIEKEKKEVTGEKLINAVKEKLFDLHPQEFEKFITHLLNVIGFEAATTRYVSDKGVDVVGTLNPDGLANIILRVQVKRSKSNISATEVRDIRGTLAHGEHGAIVTLSSFTKQAHEEAQAPGKPPIALIEGDCLVDLILKHYDELDNEYKNLLSVTKREISLKDRFFITVKK